MLLLVPSRNMREVLPFLLSEEANDSRVFRMGKLKPPYNDCSYFRNDMLRRTSCRVIVEVA